MDAEARYRRALFVFVALVFAGFALAMSIAMHFGCPKQTPNGLGG